METRFFQGRCSRPGHHRGRATRTPNGRGFARRTAMPGGAGLRPARTSGGAPIQQGPRNDQANKSVRDLPLVAWGPSAAPFGFAHRAGVISPSASPAGAKDDRGPRAIPAGPCRRIRQPSDHHDRPGGGQNLHGWRSCAGKRRTTGAPGQEPGTGVHRRALTPSPRVQRRPGSPPSRSFPPDRPMNQRGRSAPGIRVPAGMNVSAAAYSNARACAPGRRR